MDAHRLYAHQAVSQPTLQPAMSSHTLTSLTYITRDDLAATLRASPDATSPPPNLAIVDVRDSDHVGGHIRGSTWVPSSELDYRAPELVRTLRDKDVVVFHCVLSQQRGPSAALKYLREKERLDGLAGGPAAEETGAKGEGEDRAEGNEAQGKDGDKQVKTEKKAQKVLVLEGGFSEWQEKYGTDKRLTEAYQKDVWEFGY